MGAEAAEVEADPNDAVTLTNAVLAALEQQAWERGYAEGLAVCKHGRRHE